MSAQTSGIVIVAADDDIATIDAWHEIGAEATAADLPDFPPPDRHELGIKWSNPGPGARVYRALAYDGDTAVGAVSVDLPTLDNLENCDIEVTVRPAYRRRGIGRALIDAGLAKAREEGRVRFCATGVSTMAGGPQRHEAPTRFAEAVGMKPALVEVRRVLDLSTMEHGLYDRLLADAWPHAAGYSVVTWGDTTPEDCIEGVAALDSSFLEEAPLGDLEWEPEKIDADRVRKHDEVNRKYGRRRYSTAIRHDASGRIVAHTAIVRTYEQSRHAWQGITLVHPGHRGHRLGMISKVVNLKRALENEPELQVINTWNAVVNDHMIAINEAMGFRPVDNWTNWQRDL
jgi:GNAT superfamily N-acetyltransferase